MSSRTFSEQEFDFLGSPGGESESGLNIVPVKLGSWELTSTGQEPIRYFPFFREGA